MNTDHRTAIRTLFEQNHLQIFRFLRRLCDSSEVAEDLTQEVFVRASRSPAQIPTHRNEAAWLLTIARNLWIDRCRSTARRPSEVGLEQVSGNASFPVQTLRFDLKEALEGIGEMERKAILMKEVLGLSYQEIGELLGLTEGAVRSRIFRARRSLTRRLRPNQSKNNLEATS